jgi:anion-transporting  ArsA/GET3 family ATPase
LESPDLAGAPAPSLLQRRLVIVTGKGGTGKTTVAAALAVAAAQRGLRVLVAEVGSDSQVPRLIDPNAPAVGYEERAIAPRITAIRIDPYAALAEYLGLQIRVPGLVQRVVRNQAFHQLLQASPGWRELITLGKVWHLEQMRDARAPRYDRIVVDAPATGHGVTLLDVPRVVVSTVRAGPLRHHTERVEALLADPQRTLLLPVSLAEELPCRETASLVERVRSGLSVHVDRVIVNGVHDAPFPDTLADLPARLERLPESLAFEALPPPRALARCARYLHERHLLNRQYLGEIARSTRLPVVALPYLPDGVTGRDALSVLAAALVAEPRAEAS